VTEHFEVELVSAASAHVALGENAPEAPPLPKVTEPPGVDLVPPSVSDTVAVQVVPWLIATLLGEQLTAVEVVRFVTVNAIPVASELFACVLPLAV
jgi:hypothetical protein